MGGSSGSDLLARLDRIPCWPYPPHLLAIVGAGVFFAFFDIVTIAAALPVLVKEFGVSADEASQTITASLAGYMVGSFFISRAADRVGRRFGLMLSVAFFSGGSLLTATSTELWHVIVWRFVSGMGIGADIAALTSYLGEISPKRLRGRYTSISVGIGFVGIAVVPFVAEMIIPAAPWGWRALFLLGSAGGIVVLIGRRGLTPSPRWLLANDRENEARAVIEAAEATARAKLGAELPAPEPPEPLPGHVSLGELLRPPLVGKVVLFVSIWLLYYIGNYAWLSLMPELYVKHGLELSRGLWVTGLSSLGFLAGSVGAVSLADRVERKWACLAIVVAWGLLLLTVGWVGNVAVVTLAGFFASATVALFIPLAYTYTAESFPTPVCATCMAVSDGFGHLGGVLCAPIVLGAYDLFDASGYGYQAALSTMAATAFAAAILLAFGRPTRGTTV